jgi:predicted transcriptional regulator of viral defense system
MNDKEPRLGKFKMQFLAWIQLEKKTQVVTGEVSEAFGLTATQERKLLSRLSQQGLIVRVRRGLYMVPALVPPGGQWSPGEYRLVRTLMEDAGASYQIGGRVAFHQYGFDDQVPNEITVYNDKISRQSTMGGLRFTFIKVPPKRLGGSKNMKLPDGGEVKIASLPRALMDAVYDWDRYNTLPRAYVWIAARKDDRETIKELVRITLRHGNIGTMRRIGYILAKCKVSPRLLSKLKTRVSAGKSLVKLVPTRPARGDINREWGIIDNEQS